MYKIIYRTFQQLTDWLAHSKNDSISLLQILSWKDESDQQLNKRDISSRHDGSKITI